MLMIIVVIKGRK